ncbi:MAG: hypothetical protein NWF03_05370 [Candidatus Bathyarchaeota archaeon]|nr:hypothetical protein [Candidatus Bathyarchaeota archaeon]
MNRDPYAVALSNALTEIQTAYPDINHSFIFTQDNTIISQDPKIDQRTMNRIMESFEELKEKTKPIGDIQNFQFSTKTGDFTLFAVKDMYIVFETSENSDKNQIYAIRKVILPTILKVVDTIAASEVVAENHLQTEKPPKELTVDLLSGFFAGDAVQIDLETLLEIIKTDDQNEDDDILENIDHVRIETFRGDSTLCKVKEISDPNFKGKNLVRIPEKICRTLEIQKGDLVKVKPLL